MADFNSSLPVRTENPGDVIVKVADPLVSSRQMTVNADGSINTNAVVTATNLNIRDITHTRDSIKIGDGVDFVAVNTNGSLNSVVTSTNLDIRNLTTARDSVNADLRLAGTAISSTNPLPVAVTLNNVGTEINSFNTAANVAGGATSNHDYTAIGTFLLTQIEATGSGRAKIEVQVETAAASNTFTTRFVRFNSTSSPNMSVQLKSPITVTAGVRVRIVRTNRDLLAQDLYSTISGQEP